MAAATQQTPFVSQEPSATGLQDRTVEDKIRNLIPGNSPLLALVAKGTVKDGDMKESEGMISKKVTKTTRFEAFTNTPPDHLKVAGAVNSLVVTFADVTDLYVRMEFENTANNTVGIIDKIDGNDVTFVTLGSETFSVVEGDTLMRLGNAYEENSQDPKYIQKADDNIYNLTQIFRFPTAASRTQQSTKQLAGGDFFKRMKMNALREGKRDMERALIFGKKSASGNKTTLTELGVATSTTEGIFSQASAVYDAGGNFTPSKLFKDVPNAMDSSVSDSDKVVSFTSKEARGDILEFPQSSIRIDQSKNYEKTGVKTQNIVTGGSDIEIMSHDAFNNPGHKNEMLIFVPSRLQYRFMDGADIHPVKDIQGNSVDGTIDEILAEIGILADDGGVSLLKVINMF